ncbi:MAG TPA: hypothetical protein VJA94_17920, partial [Candidatus Angelobacter sp.]
MCRLKSLSDAVGRDSQLPNYQAGVPSTRAFDFARDGVEVAQLPNAFQAFLLPFHTQTISNQATTARIKTR